MCRHQYLKKSFKKYNFLNKSHVKTETGQNMSLAEGRQHMKYEIGTSQLMKLINIWLDSVKMPNTEIYSLQQLPV